MKRIALALLALGLLLPAGCAERTLRADAPEPEHILVIDAGHGGEDGGAVAPDGTLESDVNLIVALRLEALARLVGVETRMTRSTPQLDYPPELTRTAQRKTWDQRRRVQLLRETPGAVLVSVHQNKYPDPRPRGAQVLYADSAASRAFGETAHALLTQATWPENRRVAAPARRELYLLREAGCPAILAECGFLSNPEEAALLGEPDYQKRIALALLGAYLQCFTDVKGT